jgi:hypothetical protein
LNPKKEAMSNFDFSHLQVQRGATAPYDIIEIDTPEGTVDSAGMPLRHPRLKLAPATKETKQYWSKSLKRAGRRGVRARVDENAIEEGREEDLQLFPKWIVLGWEGVFNTAGEAVPFSEAECRKFLAALPEWIFSNLRIFAKDPVNFLPEDSPDQSEVDDQGNV